MSNDQLIVGLPAGSLADPSRGGSLTQLLRDAGFPAVGYDKGGPSSFPITPFLVGWDGRPQEFGAQLSLGEVDVAIGGDDWIQERQLEFKYEYNTDITLERVLPLKRGSVRLVIIACPGAGIDESACDAWLTALLKEKPLVTMVAELPYLALNWFQEKAKALGFAKSHSEYSVQKFKTPPRIKKGIVIYETWGKTEAKVKHGSVDFGMEITQTGSALRNYGLSIMADVIRSEAGVWANPDLRKNAAKYDLARMFLLNLYGAIHAENKVLLFFNAKREDQSRMLDYLRSNHLFGDEPTINEGINFIEFSIQLDASSKELPLARVRYELAKLGATAIETIPLESSIPGLNVIDF